MLQLHPCPHLVYAGGPTRAADAKITASPSHYCLLARSLTIRSLVTYGSRAFFLALPPITKLHCYAQFGKATTDPLIALCSGSSRTLIALELCLLMLLTQSSSEAKRGNASDVSHHVTDL